PHGTGHRGDRALARSSGEAARGDRRSLRRAPPVRRRGLVGREAERNPDLLDGRNLGALAARTPPEPRLRLALRRPSGAGRDPGGPEGGGHRAAPGPSSRPAPAASARAGSGRRALDAKARGGPRAPHAPAPAALDADRDRAPGHP